MEIGVLSGLCTEYFEVGIKLDNYAPCLLRFFLATHITDTHV